MVDVVPEGWPHQAFLASDRLRLEPVEVAHAEAMEQVLADPVLYEVIGGEPPTAPQLRERYGRWQTPRSADGAEGWLNWIVFRAEDDAAVGTVQATITLVGQGARAELAWVVGSSFQRRGFAVEATGRVIRWLADHDVVTLCAHVARGHTASERVAAKLGMVPTDVVVDGERRWIAPE
ncbi:GNAT family N-acetyltransferase [Lentzea tibetensis]|uniref:GNAT family N-acetyltransferase n=1 Tax=Lentzea tibetensis TaxID=2591470 RepID=A0A563F1H8_9PSEU|nr:GNAT family N-acetyltransferase [Lentzea tibetensis]TWP53601.1 GNAT family N-acetyltransferase [Lentzea tibetensis]